MPRTLEQYAINCATCGEYLWKYTSTIYNLDLMKEVDLERDDFCQKCDPKKFFATLKSADKITPLTENQRDQKSA